MARAKEEKKGATNFWLLAMLVVVATGGLIYVMGSGGDEASAQGSEMTAQPADKEVVEVSPLIPRGKIAAASWRSGTAPAKEAASAAGAEEEESTFSLLDQWEGSSFGDKDEERKRKKGIEKVVENIHGLGVYVEPAEGDDETKDK